MKFKTKLRLLIGSTVLFGPSLVCAQASPPNFDVSKDHVFWASFVMMTLILIFAFLFVVGGLLRSRDWQLGDAISEEAGNQPNPLPVGTKPVMVASSSRLIALLGLLNILGVFLGFGYYFLYSAFSGTLRSDDIRSAIYYLFSGAVMFAPYLANQLRDAFTSFGSVPQTAPQLAQLPAPQAQGAVRAMGVG